MRPPLKNWLAPGMERRVADMMPPAACIRYLRKLIEKGSWIGGIAHTVSPTETVSFRSRSKVTTSSTKGLRDCGGKSDIFEDVLVVDLVLDSSDLVGQSICLRSMAVEMLRVDWLVRVSLEPMSLGKFSRTLRMEVGE